MKEINKIILKIIIFLLLILFPMSGFAQNNNESTSKNDIIFGLKGGYSFALGYYDNIMNGSGYYGLNVIPYVTKWILIEMDVYYSQYTVKSLNEAAIHSVSMSIGPSFYYSLVPLLEIYVGVAIKGNYLYLKADDDRFSEETYKPGFVLKTGFFIPIKWGIRARIGFEYSYNELSKREFHAINFFGGISFNYYAYERTRKTKKFITNAKEIGNNYNKGLENLKNGKLQKAKECFEKVLTYDGGHKNSQKYLMIIEKTEKNYIKARKLIRNEEYFESIPYLEEAAIYMFEAKAELKVVRKKLSIQIKELEKLGVALYEDKKYSQCIKIFEKLLLIDPGNKIANIYLSKARTRYEALQKLR